MSKSDINYFSFFDLEPSPTIDLGVLKRRYLSNSKAYHPDFHTLAGESQQEDALEKSTLNNQAYRVLSDDYQRLRHLLDLHGVLGEEGENQVPQSFLLEIMDINEALMEAEFDDDPDIKTRVSDMINTLDQELDDDIRSILDNYNFDTVSPDELEKLKTYYLKKKYLIRLRDKI